MTLARGTHPFPSRTRKLSPSAPIVLHAQVCGRVGSRPVNSKNPTRKGRAFYFSHKFFLLRTFLCSSQPHCIAQAESEIRGSVDRHALGPLRRSRWRLRSATLGSNRSAASDESRDRARFPPQLRVDDEPISDAVQRIITAGIVVRTIDSAIRPEVDIGARRLSRTSSTCRSHPPFSAMIVGWTDLLRISRTAAAATAEGKTPRAAAAGSFRCA